MNAVLIIDKPAGLTSHDVVNRVRGILGERSVGHLGTLDPLATGVLPLVVGSLTRLAQFYTDSEKRYEGTVRFGFATDTYDAEGEPAGAPQAVRTSLSELQQLAAGFRGTVKQMPPPFSAKKIHGVPAYKLARRKKEVKLEPVEVEIREFEITAFAQDCASFRARVGPGTYMRSVAHELGSMVGCGAHLASLRRTGVAEFTLAEAHTLASLARAAEEGQVTVNDELAAMIRSGRAVNLPEFSRAKQVKVFHGQSDLIAIATRVAGTLFHPRIVLAGTPVAPVSGQR